MTIEEQVDIEFKVQESLWFAYEQADQELKDRGWVKPPNGERLSRDQIRARIENQAAKARNFRIPGASYSSFKRRS